MPTRKRRARDREIAAERTALATRYDTPMPIHVTERLGRPSKLLTALSLQGTSYAWNGLRVDNETDAVFLPNAPADQGANVERMEEAMRRALELREENPKDWNTRGGAKLIAARSGMALSTVYAHMARLRKT